MDDKNKILEQLNATSKSTLMETLEMEYIDVGNDFLTLKMPVTPKVHQPQGILHGGATAALAETAGSAASALFINRKAQIVKGLELSINHVKSKTDGVVFAKAQILHKGSTTHIWQINITDEENNLISICKMSNIVLDKR